MAALFENQSNLLIKLRLNKLEGFAKELENQFLNEPVFASMSIEERLLLCIEAQETYAKQRRCATLIKNAKFKDNLRMSDLTLSLPSIELSNFAALSAVIKASITSLQWVNKGVNILVTGACGVGKTALINAIGYNCCNNGITVKNFRTSDLFENLSQMTALGKHRFKESLKRTKVLILDDFAITPFNEEQRKDLFDIIDDRQKIGSTIIASQLKKATIQKVFGNDAKGESSYDRFINPCIEIILQGESRRTAEGEKRKQEALAL